MTGGAPIAVFGPFHPHRGGIAHHTTLLAETLAARHPVLGVGFKRLYPSILFPGKTQIDASATAFVPRGVEVRQLVDSIAPHTWWRAAGAIRAFGTRLLVVQWWHPFFAPCCAAIARGAKRGGARVVYVCHNVLPHERSRIDTALARLGLGAADAFIVQNRPDLDLITSLYPNRPRELTPLPTFTFFARGASMDRDAARAALGVSGPVVLFFGLVRAYKGLDVLLRAVATARERVPITLVVAGEFYQDRAPYDALVHSLGLDDAVHIHARYVPNEEVETFFRAADVVVLPYTSATQTAVAQIALSFERPVIVTRTGGLPEAVREGETGFVVPPGDAPALAAALVDFFATGAATRLAAALRGSADAFPWDAMAAAVRRVGSALGVPTPSESDA
jgi:glycosyltransferase involved in cell wall biosynthesis